MTSSNKPTRKHKIFRIIGLLTAIAIILVTLLTLTSYIAWNPYLELLSHFKLQYLVLSLLLLIPLLLIPIHFLHPTTQDPPAFGTPLIKGGRGDQRKGFVADISQIGVSNSKLWLFTSLFCLTIQLVAVLSWYIPPAWSSKAQTHNLRILLANIYVRNQSYDKVLALVKQENPDIAVFQEVDETWANQLQPLKSSYPYTMQEPDTTVYSRSPLKDVSVFGVGVKRSIAATLTINNQNIRLVATHPLPPAPWLAKLRNEQLNQVAEYIKQQRSPVILIGDLNVTMWSPYYTRLVAKTRLKNTRQGFGILPTWPVPTKYASTHPILAFFKPLLWIPIDHCLVSPTIQATRIRTGQGVDSDHLPLIVDLSIPNYS